MASIALRNIRCIDYLAYVSIFTHGTFCPKIKLDVFFSARKAVDERWEVVTLRLLYAYLFCPKISFFGEYTKIHTKDQHFICVFVKKIYL